MAKDLFCESRMKELDEIIDTHSGERGNLMPVLHHSQKLFGCIPFEVQKIIADKLDMPMADIYGVVTFYSHFSIEPKGEKVISVCMGTACYVKNAGKILDDISRDIGVEPGKTGEDGLFTLQGTRCIGACGLAPLITVNEAVYGRLTSEKEETLGIIAKYKKAAEEVS